MTISTMPTRPPDDLSRLEALGRFDILDTAPERGFDDIVELARIVCDAPVALVSLVAGDRQWFKARAGFEPCETSLDRSICKHVLGAADLLVISDLTLDRRTQANPLVTGTPFMRFYAGAPLETAEGIRLGSLCVIDTEPRPAGLTSAQAEALRALSRQVMAQMDLRNAMAERERLLAGQRADAHFMQRVLASSADCIKVLDLDTRLTFMSEGGMRVMEVGDFNAIKGCPWPDFWTGQGNADAHAAIAAAKAGGTGHFQGPAETFAGTPRWWDVQVTPILDAEGRPEKLLSVSRDITGQKLAERATAASEARWRGLFEGMREGFHTGEILRNADGTGIDFRYLEVNPAFEIQSGLPVNGTAGRTLREVIPTIPQGVIDNYVRVVDTGEPAAFEIEVPALRRWFEVRARADGGQRFNAVFLDISERKSAERRQAALIELADALRDLTNRAHIVTAASAIAARTLGLDHAGYGSVDDARETIAVEHDWTGPGRDSLAGLHRFRDYGSYIDALKRGETVVVADMATDPRAVAECVSLAAFGVRALVNVPVMENGRFVGLFFTLSNEPRAWTSEETGFLRNVADRIRAALARIEAEERQDLLNSELSHRMKNLLAMVQAIAVQTTRGAPDVETVREKLGHRLIALGKAHDVLLGGSADRARMDDIVRGGVGVHDDGESARFSYGGPDIEISGDAALSLGLMLHELSTNAAKYGALSVPEGHVAVSWSVADVAGEPTVRFAWRETGGPPVVPPTRKGFGSRLIERGLTGQVGGTLRLDYPETGVTCVVDAPLRGFVKHT